MAERTPTAEQLAAYGDFMFQLFKHCADIIDDAAARHESEEVRTQRVLHRLASLAVNVDEVSIEVVDAYLSAVEDGSPRRPIRRALLRQVLARMSADG